MSKLTAKEIQQMEEPRRHPAYVEANITNYYETRSADSAGRSAKIEVAYPFTPGVWHPNAGEFFASAHIGLVVAGIGYDEGYVYDPAFLVSGEGNNHFILRPTEDGGMMWQPVKVSVLDA